MAEHRELDDVAAEEQRDRPVDDDAQLPREQRELVQVVRPRHEPAGEAPEVEARDLRDALEAAERRDLAEHAVAVRLRARRSGSSRAGAPGGARAGTSAGRRLPASSRSSPQRSRRAPTRRRTPRRAASRRRRRGRARRAGRRARAEAGSRGRPPSRRAFAPGSASRSRAPPRGRRTTRASSRRGSRRRALEPARRVLPEPARDLGEDLRRRVDEHPALWRLAERGVGAERGMRHVVQLGQRLDARVARADEHEAELGRVVRDGSRRARAAAGRGCGARSRQRDP